MMAYRYVVTAIDAVTPDISKILLTPESKQTFHYVAGQYIEVQLNAQHIPLSIANAPRPDGCLEFHLRHNDTHPFAQQLYSQIALQKILTLQGPFGESTLNQFPRTYQKLILLAGGTGFAPIKALLEAAFLDVFWQRANCEMVFVWGIRQLSDAYEHAWLESLKQRYPHFSYHFVIYEKSAAPKTWRGATGLLSTFLKEHCSTLNNSCLFASGPYLMVKDIENYCQRFGNDTILISDMLAQAK